MGIVRRATADDLGNEITARLRIANERLDAGAPLIASTDVPSGPYGVRAGCPHVCARNLIPVATDQPIEGRHTSLSGERWILLREVTSRARQCPRITRGLLRQRDRLVEQLRLLRRGEPFAFIAGRELYDVGKDRRRRFMRVLLRDRAEPREVGSGPVRGERVTRLRVVDVARGQENLFTDASMAASLAQRLRQFSA